MNKFGVITLILLSVIIFTLVFYVYLEMSKKALKNLKDRSTKIVTTVKGKKNEIYILGEKDRNDRK
jgi:hypothetical protein